jgi:hypothetical protein
MQCLHYKPVSNHSCSGGRGGGIKSVVEVSVNSKKKNSSDFFPITSKNSASGYHTVYTFPFNKKISLCCILILLACKTKINNHEYLSANVVLLTQIELAVVEDVLLLLNGVLEGGDVLGELCLLLVQHLHLAHQHRLLMRQLPDKCKVNDLSSIEDYRAASKSPH